MMEATSIQTLAKSIQFFYRNSLKNGITRNVKWYLTVSFLLTLIFYKANQIMRPPKHLRHIPHLSFIGMVYSIITKESYAQISKKNSIPMVNSPGNNGLYLKPGRHGWVINVSDPVALKTLLMKHDLFPRKNITTGLENSLFLKFAGVHNMLLIGGERSKQQRQLVTPAIRRAKPARIFGKIAQDLLQVIDSTNGTVNFLHMMERFSLEAIGLAEFGFDFNAIKDKNSKWVHQMSSIKDGMMDPLFYVFSALDKKENLWMFPKRKEIHENTEQFLSMLDTVIENKRKEIKSRKEKNETVDEHEKDLLTLMIESEGTEGEISDIELKSNLCLFYLAGHDTTSISLTTVFYYLAKYPEFQKRARKEAIDILGDEPKDVLPTEDQIKQMKFISQVIKEGLRLNGPTPQGLPRLATEDTVLAGVHIPKGSVLSPNMHDVHHNYEKWKDPFKFDPDRFDESRNELKSTKDGLFWAPFLYGYRQCIGMDFSFQEQKVLISMMLRKYTFSLPEDSIHKESLVTVGLLIISPKDLDLTFKKRY